MLAAGEGARLRPITADRPKCLVPLAGVPLLDRQLRVLTAAAATDVVIVGGYRAAMLGGRGARLVVNGRYNSTDMVASLFCAADALMGDLDVVVAYGDIVYEPRVLAALLDCNAPLAIVADLDWQALWRVRFAEPLDDAETFRMRPDGRIVELGRRPRSYDDVEAQYIGLWKVRADCAPALRAAYAALARGAPVDGIPAERMCMTSFLQRLIDQGWHAQAVPIRGGWLEVDYLADLAAYERLHQTGMLSAFCQLELD